MSSSLLNIATQTLGKGDFMKNATTALGVDPANPAKSLMGALDKLGTGGPAGGPANTVGDVISKGVGALGALGTGGPAGAPSNTVGDVMSKGVGALEDVVGQGVGSMMGGPASTGESRSQDQASNAPTAEEKKLKALQAYYDVIASQKETIRKHFVDGLKTYVDTHLKVKNDKLTQFMEEVIYRQMKEYFDTVNTSYVQHAILSQIFTKNKNLVMNVLQQSISRAGILPNTDVELNAAAILHEFRSALAEMESQNSLIRGGDASASNPEQYISEIASWFPLNDTIEDVNRDIKYVIQSVFVETMREKNTLENVVGSVLSKHMCLITKALRDIVNKQTLQVDVALLQASISGKGDIQDTMILCIQNALREYANKKATPAAIASAIYYGVITMANDTYKKDMEAAVAASVVKNPLAPVASSAVNTKGGGSKSKRRRTRKNKSRRKT